MAVHGVTRSTRDLDLLVSDPSSLDPSYWQALQNEDIDVSVRAGAPDDPLAGVIRLRTAGETVDVIVARPAWQREVPRRATITEIDGVPVPVARRADLVLLKLYAGGPQDAWDIEQLLGATDAAALTAEVDARVVDLPADARTLWRRLRRRPG